jgi:hypothetical protein
MRNYPRIGEPQKRPDGVWCIAVELAEGEREEMPFADEATARAAHARLQGAIGGGTGKIEHVRGPYHSRTRGYWFVRWREGDRDREFHDPDRAVVLARRNELVGSEQQARRLTMPKLPAFGSPMFFKRAFAAGHKMLVDAIQAGDFEGAKMARLYVRGLKEISDGYTPHAGYAEMEQRLEEMVDYLEATGHQAQVEFAAQLSAATAGPDATLGGTARPEDALSGPVLAVPDRGRPTEGGDN